MRKLYATLLLFIFVLPITGWSQLLAWNLNGNAGNETSVTSTTTDPHLNASSLTRGAGVVSSTLANGFTGSGWNVTTLADAVTNNKYYQFTVSASNGFQANLSTLDAYFRRSSTGPTTFQWEYSLDGFASAGVTIGSPISYTLTTTNGDAQTQLDLSGITALQNAASSSTITVRLYGWGASASGGTFAIGRPTGANSLAIGGSATAIVTSTPTITSTPAALSGFSTAQGTASSAQQLTIGGSNLTANIVAAAPTGFEVSLDGNSYASSVSLPSTGGTISTRISASAPAGSVSGNLTLSSTGATTQNVALSGTVTSTGTATANVVINQVFGGGGNSGAQYANDFVELYNNESFAVNLSGWSVQYTSSTGTTWQVTALSGTVPAHGFFLVQEAVGANTSATPLPAPDLTGIIAMSSTSGKVILSNGSTALTGADPTGTNVIDKVGYGAANGYETAAAPTLSNTTSDIRITDGVDNNDNATDFEATTPLPRNSTYTTTAPTVISYNPAVGSKDIPVSYVPFLIFSKPVVKGSGAITLVVNGVSSTPIDISDSRLVVSNDTLTINLPLSGNTTYGIEIAAGAIKDAYNNAFAGLPTATAWTFKTYDNSAAVATFPYTNDFNTCTGSGLLPGGFTTYNVTGAQIWDCTPYGRDPNAPQGSDTANHAVQVNGYANGVNNTNEDWLISPKFDLTATAYPLLSFWSRNAYAGNPLQLRVSTNYTGSGDPRNATWTTINGKFPSVGSDTWTQSSNLNLSDYKQAGVYFAFVYTSTTDDGSRWTVDDIQLVNSATPPPPTLTLSTGNVEFGYAAPGTTPIQKIQVTGNDLTGNITITSEGSYLVSTDSVHFAATATINADTANNKTEPLFIQFAPTGVNMQFIDSLTISIPDTTGTVNVKGNTIDPTSTLSIVDWNLNWFGTPDPTLGVANKTLQEQNVGQILPSLHADLYALQEVVNEPALAAIVATMPGYAYIINNYGSYSSTAIANPDPLNTVQKLAFVYNTAKISIVRTDSLLTTGINTAADTATKYYNDFASGRFPYMLTANVKLNDPNGGTNTKTIRFINLHAKANTSPVLTAYARRQDGAHAIDSLLKAAYPNDNVMMLGDFNDDLNQTITAGVTPPITSYSSFTIDDSALYVFPTKLLSQQGQHSDVNYSSVIDNVIINKNMASFYLPSSATVLSSVASLVTNYGTTTTDHYPVFTQFSFTPPATPLPVTWLSFTGTKEDNSVKLDWATATESNTSYFEVQRSTDNVHFTAIGTVAAKGNSSTTSNYTFADQQPQTGYNYYRLRQVDLDNNATWSKMVRVSFTTPLALHISPNPAHGAVNLVIGGASDTYDIQIVDLNGRIVRQQQAAPGMTTVSIDMTHAAKGIYTVKVISASTTATQKLWLQ